MYGSKKIVILNNICNKKKVKKKNISQLKSHQMEDDSVDRIEISSKSYDSFRTSLILLRIYDQTYEKVTS